MKYWKQSKTSFSLTNNLIAILLFLISLFCIRCANMQAPTGGPKDSIPPKLLNVSVPNLTRNFDHKEVVFEFDEYIKLNNHYKEFSISPDVEKQPDYKIKKKKLIITLPDSLEKNTTYTINFGNGLVDFNESNPFKNYTYVFSTGPELDSLTISGKVSNAFTKEFDPKEDLSVRVLLIPTRQDSIFGKKKANIFTGVDSSGNFKFQNLRADTYRIYAIKEENNDRIYNHPHELIGFYALDTIRLDKNIENIYIEYAKGKPKEFKIQDRKIQKDSRITLSFNQPLDSPAVRIIDPEELNEKAYVKFSELKDSVNIMLEKLEFDSIKLVISDYNKDLDTTLIRRSKNEKYDRELIPQLNITNKVNKVEHITITSTFPIESIDKNKIILKEDTLSRRNFQLQKDTLKDNLYHIRFNWKPKKSYELTIQESAIKSIFGDTNKEFKAAFAYDEAENFGDMIFKINGLDSNVYYIAEIIDEKKTKVYDRKILYNSNTLHYTKFPGGKYLLRIIKDINGNGRWDGVDVYNKIQPEPIWYLDKPFVIRSNWEQNETITPKFE